MAFTASLLSKNDNRINESINALVSNPDNDSYIYGLLEMNDEYHAMSVNDKINLYRSLMENADSEVFDENKILEVRDFIAKLLEPIFRFLGIVIRKLSELSVASQTKYESYTRNYNKMHFPDNSWYNDPTTVKKIRVFIYPNIASINTSKYKALLDNLIEELNKIYKNNFSDDMIKDFEYPAIRDLAKAIYDTERANGYSYSGAIKDLADLRTMIKSSVCVEETKSMNFNEYMKYFNNLRFGRTHIGYRDYSAAISDFESVLRKAKSISSSSAINTPAQQEYVEKIISRIKDVTTAYTAFIDAVRHAEDAAIAYNNRFFANHITMDTVTESGDIHGEPFNSDTLFDNEDIRDFNRTEWLDLSLTSECYNLKYEADELHNRIACMEANIMAGSGRKYAALIAMREAEVASAGDRVKAIFENIKKIIDKFVESIKSRSSIAANMLRRNMSFIKNPVKIKSVKSKGDILAGMSRLSKPITIVPFNYDTLKADLESKEKFFENRILPSMRESSQYSKRKLTYKSGMHITEYCKAYFGASMPSDTHPVCEFTGAEIESSKNAIIAFVNNTSSVFSCKADLAKLEAESKRFINAPAPVQQASTETGGNNAEAKNESYHSELYAKYFTEAEIEMDKPKEDSNQAENSTTSDNGQSAAYKVYLDCYKDVILSKITAAEFVYSELVQIMNAHARSYMSDEQKKAEADATAKDNGIIKSKK